MKIICHDRRSRMTSSQSSGRAVHAISADIDRLLEPKTLEQLRILERQISQKLQSNEPIDVEYWEQLLQNIAVYKAKAELKRFYKSVVDSRLRVLRGQQVEEAELVKSKLSILLGNSATTHNASFMEEASKDIAEVSLQAILCSKVVDPEPLLKIRIEDKGLDIIGESDFMDKIVGKRDIPST